MVNSNHSQQQLTLPATTNTKQQLTRTMSGARWKDSKMMMIIIIIIIIIMYIYISVHVPDTLVMKEKESIYQKKKERKKVQGKTKS